MLSDSVNRQTLGALENPLGHAYWMEAWNDRLRRIRNATRPRLSQVKVAKAFGIAPASVAQWELGRSRPAIDKLARLARLYGVSLEDLAGHDLSVNGVGASLEAAEDVFKTVEQQILYLSRAWPLLSPGERSGLIATIEAIVEPRREPT